MGNHVRTLFAVILSIFLIPAHAVVDSGVTVPSGFIAEIAAQGLTNPTAMEFAPDGRLFVTEQGGKLRVIKNGALLPTPFLTVSVDSSGERGLLGVTFDPDFSSNQFVYIYYTVPGSPPHNRIARFTANGDVAAPGSSVILELETLSSTNHNGGAIHFGLDGKLYIAVGENVNRTNSQQLTNRLGKLLRLNSDGTLPSDNPTSFSGVSGTNSGVNRAIWAIGLRNPFTFSINRNTGRLIINDVGQSTWEEVNIGTPGGNYGWPITEGPTSNPDFTSPLYAYRHSGSTPSGCAITGGAFYDSSTFPSTYVGKYFFSDFCGNWIYFLDPDISNPTSTQFATGIASPVDLKVGLSDGALYYLARGKGLVGRIRSTSNDPPPTGSGLLVISQDTLEVREGSSRIFTVQLSNQPAGTVNVSIAKVLSDQSVSVSPASLTFTTSNWNITRNITVFAGEDNGDRVD